MIRYVETFYRHRLLTLMPLILAVGISVGIALAQPRMYESSAGIWFYGTALAGTAPGQPYTNPADEQSAVLRELLNSRTFCDKVGHRGPLAAYLEQGLTIPSNVVSAVGTRLGLSRFTRASGSVDDQIYEVLSQKVVLSTTGPQVVAIRFAAPDPAVAQGTVQALVDQFSDEILGNLRTQAQAAVDFFQQQVTAQAAEVSTDNNNVATYQAAHPKSGASDANLVALQHAAELASQRYDQSLLELDRAKSDLAAESQAAGAGFHAIDAPSLPERPAGQVALLLRALAAGVLAGLLVGGFTVLTLTAADTSLRHGADVRNALGLRLVGEIPQLRS
jgi:uncharacterized protein involved in exopolysaccharide biosynthesis